MATPLKYTPEIAAGLAADIASGLSVADACVNAGISRPTFTSWMQRGEAGEEPFAALSLQVARARVARKRESIKRIRALGVDDWKSEAWLLERMEPADFGARAKMEVTGADGGPLRVAAVDLSRLTPDELRQAIALRRKAEADDASHDP